MLYHESSKDCSLTTAGELFGRSGYGVGLPKGSIWTNDISLAILNFHESGKMEELETLWNCPEISNAPATLGLSHMLGRYTYSENRQRCYMKGNSELRVNDNEELVAICTNTFSIDSGTHRKSNPQSSELKRVHYN